MRILTRRFVAVVLCGGAFACGLAAALEAAGAPPEPATNVFGYVWDTRNEPIPEAPVRLRDASSGRVEAHAIATGDGEFSFQDIEGGTYLLEYVDGRGRVLAVGHVFTIEPGETVATFIRLTARAPRLAALFGRGSNVAAAAIVSAASLGLSAMAPSGRDVTPER